jgi:hypothetical protein
MHDNGWITNHGVRAQTFELLIALKAGDDCRSGRLATLLNGARGSFRRRGLQRGCAAKGPWHWPGRIALQETSVGEAFGRYRGSPPPRTAARQFITHKTLAAATQFGIFFVWVRTLVFGLLHNAIVDHVGPEWSEKETWRMFLNPMITKFILSIIHLFQIFIQICLCNI